MQKCDILGDFKTLCFTFWKFLTVIFRIQVVLRIVIFGHVDCHHFALLFPDILLLLCSAHNYVVKMWIFQVMLPPPFCFTSSLVENRERDSNYWLLHDCQWIWFSVDWILGKITLIWLNAIVSHAWEIYRNKVFKRRSSRD